MAPHKTTVDWDDPAVRVDINDEARIRQGKNSPRQEFAEAVTRECEGKENVHEGGTQGGGIEKNQGMHEGSWNSLHKREGEQVKRDESGAMSPTPDNGDRMLPLLRPLRHPYFALRMIVGSAM